MFANWSDSSNIRPNAKTTKLVTVRHEKKVINQEKYKFVKIRKAMRLKDIPILLGIKPKAREYGYENVVVRLPADGELTLAQWQHPKAGKIGVSQEEIDALRFFLKAGDVAIDIGAYTGDTAIPMALAVGASGTVLALEPNRYVFPVLEKNSEFMKGKGNIIPLPFAATPTDCSMEFEYSDPGFCNGGFHEGISQWKHGHGYKLKVEGKNLSNYLYQHYSKLIPGIRYIKVDAEGFDCAVLESISEIIEKQRPFIRVEVFKHSDFPYRKRLYNFLKKYNYVAYLFGSTTEYKGQLVMEDDLMKWKHYDLFAIPKAR
jgi:FkbM family methyltransferase